MISKKSGVSGAHVSKAHKVHKDVTATAGWNGEVIEVIGCTDLKQVMNLALDRPNCGPKGGTVGVGGSNSKNSSNESGNFDFNAFKASKRAASSGKKGGGYNSTVNKGAYAAGGSGSGKGDVGEEGYSRIPVAYNPDGRVGGGYRDRGDNDLFLDDEES